MKKVVFVIVFVILTLQSFAVREPPEYVGSCTHGTMRCAGSIVQECINRQWFVEMTCQTGKICDEKTHGCVVQKKELQKPSFSVRKAPECMDGESRCDQAHVFFYCSTGFWQKEQCKTGFRCDVKRRGCVPFRPYIGLQTTKIGSKKSVTILPGKSKFQPASVKRYTQLPTSVKPVFVHGQNS